MFLFRGDFWTVIVKAPSEAEAIDIFRQHYPFDPSKVRVDFLTMDLLMEVTPTVWSIENQS